MASRLASLSEHRAARAREQQGEPTGPASGPVAATRVDPAHPQPAQRAAREPVAVPADVLDATPEVLAALAGLIPEAAAEQLEKQAAELAGWLREREEQLDHREGQIQIQSAELDKRMRQARLWIQDREQELHTRESEHRAIAADISRRGEEMDSLQAATEGSLAGLRSDLARRDAELKARAADLADLDAEQRRREAELEETGIALLKQAEALQAAERMWHAERAAQEQALRERAAVIAPATQAVPVPADPPAPKAPPVIEIPADERELLLAQLAREREQLAREAHEERELLFEQLARERRLWEQEREELLAGKPVAATVNLQTRTADTASIEAELDAARQMLADERRELEGTLAAEQQELAAERARVQSEWHERRAELARRAEALEGRRAAVEQLHSDVTQLHREALEMRLLTEELWGQVSARISPAQLTQAVAHLRTKLADHYRLAEQSLSAKHDDIRQLTARLEEHQARLREQRQSVQDWVAARTAEIEEQATRLVAREQQLAAQAKRHQTAQRAWEQERRRLTSQLAAA